MENSSPHQTVKVNRRKISGQKAVFRRQHRVHRTEIVVKQIVRYPSIPLISAALIAVKGSVVNTEEKHSSVQTVQIELTSTLAFGEAQF